MGQLHEKMKADLKLRRYSPRTIKSYLSLLRLAVPLPLRNQRISVADNAQLVSAGSTVEGSAATEPASWQELFRALTGIDLRKCPSCKWALVIAALSPTCSARAPPGSAIS